MNGINQAADMDSGRNSPGLDLALRICPRSQPVLRFEENRWFHEDRIGADIVTISGEPGQLVPAGYNVRSTQPDFRRSLTL
jgi:hypothetical protein